MQWLHALNSSSSMQLAVLCRPPTPPPPPPPPLALRGVHSLVLRVRGALPCAHTPARVATIFCQVTLGLSPQDCLQLSMPHEEARTGIADRTGSARHGPFRALQALLPGVAQPPTGGAENNTGVACNIRKPAWERNLLVLAT